MIRCHLLHLILMAGVATTLGASSCDMALVREGDPVAVVVLSDDKTIPAAQRKAEQRAADVIVDWVEKITDARLKITRTVPAVRPAIFVGRAALDQGLSLTDIESPGSEGLKVVVDGQRALIAGQNPTSTVKAACRFLEELGCRYFMDHPLGEVYPRTRTLSVGAADISEKPGLLHRRIWGSHWSGATLWKIWNGHGGIPMSPRHGWGYVSQDLFETHPEYFALIDGERKKGPWLCTSNPELRRVFADGVIAAIDKGNPNPSLSPPDGNGYCQCGPCRAQDDPEAVEPTSGRVGKTNRYVDFFQYVAARVAEVHPESVLNFYCYADYTQPPSGTIDLRENLCAWIAPIRYCRYHAIGRENCPSRKQLASLIDGWAGAADKLAYRTYNYNLAECLVPFSKLSIWKHDIPYLAEQGCVGISLETLANWQIYGPHIYLSIRLAYDPSADADALMADYFHRFHGPDAGPVMAEYWAEVDRAFAELDCHTGSFYALHRVYTPERLARLKEILDRAAAAVEGDETLSARLAMVREGLRNAQDYMALRNALNGGEIAEAGGIYDDLLERSRENNKSGLGNHYTVHYLKRFLGMPVEAAVKWIMPPNRLLGVLPDKWKLAYEEKADGAAEGYPLPEYDDAGWAQVSTFADPLNCQGFPDRLGMMWYRTTFTAPASPDPLKLLFTEVDGRYDVYLNGREVEKGLPRRSPMEVDISGAVVEGENLLAVRVDHSQLTELDLGGIIRPVLLIAAPAAEGK